MAFAGSDTLDLGEDTAINDDAIEGAASSNKIEGVIISEFFIVGSNLSELSWRVVEASLSLAG